MSLRFPCVTCGQKLRVRAYSPGQTVTCPKCTTKQPIPQPTTTATTPSSNLPSLERVLLSEQAADDDLRVEVVYENVKDLLEVNLGQARTNLHANLECIALPRYVIFTQGFLLAFVGIGCFLLGLAVGGAITQGDSTAQPQTNSAAHLSGVVSLLKQGKRSGDAGAVVVLLPLSAAPESKGSLTGLRPGDTGENWNKSKEFVASFGGVVTQCDEHGHYELIVPQRGKYYLLVISSTATRHSGASVSQRELGQMSKYFDLADDPLEKFRYQWRLQEMNGDRSQNVDFD